MSWRYSTRGSPATTQTNLSSPPASSVIRNIPIVRLRMPLEPNRNHIGTMYAGALFAIAELPGGILPLSVLQGTVMPIVTNVDITFRRAARSDVTLEARLEPAELRRLGDLAVAEGKAVFVLELSVRDEADVEVANTVSTYQLRPVASG